LVERNWVHLLGLKFFKLLTYSSTFFFSYSSLLNSSTTSFWFRNLIHITLVNSYQLDKSSFPTKNPLCQISAMLSMYKATISTHWCTCTKCTLKNLLYFLIQPRGLSGEKVSGYLILLPSWIPKTSPLLLFWW